MSFDIKALIVFSFLFAVSMGWITLIEQARRKRRGPTLAEMLRLFGQLSDEQQEQALAILRNRVKANKQ